MYNCEQCVIALHFKPGDCPLEKVVTFGVTPWKVLKRIILRFGYTVD